MRWLKELFNPKLKCQRKGHNWAVDIFKIRVPSTVWVAEDWDAKQVKCKRCGKTHAIHKIKRTNGYSRVRMPKDMWDAMNENGYLILKYW